MRVLVIVALALGVAVAGCGKKGDPVGPGAERQEQKQE